MRWGIVAGCLLLLSAFAGVAAADDSLIVSAGLDQDVVLGDTVYLDAGGTHAVDGDISSYSWAIQTPEGDTITPDCESCEETAFEPGTTGQYDVTLTASTESGVERSDTLYVTVSAYSAGETDVTVASSDSDPESGAGDSDGCFVSFEGGDGDGMSPGICDHVGGVVDSELGGDGNHVESFTVTDGELMNRYSDIEKVGEDKWEVPAESLIYESDDIWEEHQEENQDSRDVGDGNRGSSVGNSDDDDSSPGSGGGGHPCAGVPTSVCDPYS